MKVVIVAGGEAGLADTAAGDVFAGAELIIAADSGLDTCVDLGIWPDVVVGDLDSADPGLVAQAGDRGIEILDYPTDKDATDLELALELAVTRGADQIEVAAAFGGRLDHELANIALLASPKWRNQQVSAHDGGRSIWVVRHAVLLHASAGQTVTLLPWSGDATGVTTTGLKWRLENATLPLGTTRGVSNIATAPTQTVAIETGVVLVIVDRRA